MDDYLRINNTPVTRMKMRLNWLKRNPTSVNKDISRNDKLGNESRLKLLYLNEAIKSKKYYLKQLSSKKCIRDIGLEGSKSKGEFERLSVFQDKNSFLKKERIRNSEKLSLFPLRNN